MIPVHAVVVKNINVVVVADSVKAKKKMPKELGSKSSIVTMRFTRENISPTQAYQLLAVATTSIPGEIRAKYLRDRHIFIVHADVQVDAIGAAPLELNAVVRVELTYKGDMVRSSAQTREKINDRLQDLAQQHCAQTMQKEIIRDSESAENRYFHFHGKE